MGRSIIIKKIGFGFLHLLIMIKKESYQKFWLPLTCIKPSKMYSVKLLCRYEYADDTLAIDIGMRQQKTMKFRISLG